MYNTRRAKIIVYLERIGLNHFKYFIGNDDQVYAEAHDWMYEVVSKFIEDNNIEDPNEQALIAEEVNYHIEWEDENPCHLYAIVDSRNSEEPVYGVYLTRADAEEEILEYCEAWAYEIMMTESPEYILGVSEWEWQRDFYWLLKNTALGFDIFEAPVFDIKKS